MVWLYQALVYPWQHRHRRPSGIDAPLVAIEFASLTPDAASRLLDVARELIPHGFVDAGHFRQPQSTDPHDREAYLSVWVHPAEDVVARAVWVRFAHAEVAFVMTSFALSFTTAFTDGSEIVTTNSPTVSPFPPDPSIDGVGWQGMNHPAMLYRLHRARAARLRDGRETVATPTDSAGIDALMRATQQRVIDWTVRRGYLRRGPDGSLLPTLRGSYLMTWRMLWPWKQMKVAQLARKLRRTLAEFPDIAAEAERLPPSRPAITESFPGA